MKCLIMILMITALATSSFAGSYKPFKSREDFLNVFTKVHSHNDKFVKKTDNAIETIIEAFKKDVKSSKINSIDDAIDNLDN